MLRRWKQAEKSDLPCEKERSIGISDWKMMEEGYYKIDDGGKKWKASMKKNVDVKEGRRKGGRRKEYHGRNDGSKRRTSWKEERKEGRKEHH